MIIMLLDIALSDIIVDHDVDASWHNFNTRFLSVMDQCIPSTYLPTRCNRPWLNKRIIQLIRKKNSLFVRAKHCP